MQILIPMAGSGIEFVEAGYKNHQPTLPTFSRSTGKKIPMVVCAASDLPGIEDNGQNIFFVDRDFHKDDGVEDKIRQYFPGSKFITLDGLTNGQASTCLCAKNELDEDEELLIAASDNGMVCNIDYFNELRHECDVIVFTYRHDETVLQKPNLYGWMKVDDDNNVVDVSVKKTISMSPMDDHAVVSTFWFKRASIFIDATEKMINDNDRINNQFYVDEAIRYVLRSGYKVKVFEIDRYIGWGTPKDYERYQLTFDYWKGFLEKVDTQKSVIPFTIGVAGDSGSGKSTLIKMVEEVIGEKNVLILEGDGEHKWERNSDEWNNYTHLDVDANNIYFQANNLQLLKNGSAIKRHEYDHVTGKFSSEHICYPKPYVILCGLHSFYLPQNRKNLDLKIFMDVDEELRRFWKIKRDIGERGHDLSGITKQIEYRKEDAKKYVEPQKKYADIQIRYYDNNLRYCNNKSYKEHVHVDIELYKEDVICGPIHKVIEFISNQFDVIKCNLEKKPIISFAEEEVEDIIIPVYQICRKFDINLDGFNIYENTELCGKAGIISLIMIAYISEKRQYD